MLAEHVETYSADSLVFTAKEGGPIRHNNFYKRHFRPAVSQLQDIVPEGLRFHDLRHTCAAILIADGAHIKEVKAHLGHRSIRITERYALFENAKAARADMLEATFQDSLGSLTAEVLARPAPSSAVSPTTCKFKRAEDGIRNRDPHLGKVA